MAHEFRNPLATALWCAQLLGRLAPEERAGARGLKLAATAQRAMARVGRLLEDHFLVERLEAGGLALRPEPVELLAAARRAGEEAGLGASATFAVPEGLAAEVDRALLARCLEAVAAAAGRDGAAVRVEAEPRQARVVLRIAGAPLGPDVLERPRKGSLSDPAGRALGLFAASAAAEAMGGSLAVEGGAVVLTLPGKGG